MKHTKSAADRLHGCGRDQQISRKDSEHALDHQTQHSQDSAGDGYAEYGERRFSVENGVEYSDKAYHRKDDPHTVQGTRK